MIVTPDDAQYDDLTRGFNQRWVSRPEYIYLVGSAREVQRAVREAVRADKKLAIRSGGHAYEDFVDNPKTQVIIDLSEYKKVSYDRKRQAFAVQAGATLGEVYEALFKHWGVTIPAGSCPAVGAGGHVAGGGYGRLSRLHGLVSDHLWAVEVVVVDRRGQVRLVFASRDSDDEALRDLWWAHTGGGGGNFGAVTRYWFRSPGATGNDPEQLLPIPPEDVWVNIVAWPWDRMTQASFSRLMKNYGGWLATHSAAGGPYAGLFSHLHTTHQAASAITLVTQMDATAPQSEQLLTDFIAAVSEGVGVAPQPREHRKLPWWRATNWPGLFGGDPTGRSDFKSAYLRTNFTDAQVSAFYRHLTRNDFHNPAAMVQIVAYGGRTNTIPTDATASAHRDSIMILHFVVAWGNEVDDARNVTWLREFYRDLFADTGGVPVPNGVTDGCFINFADIDISDPAWNSSGVPWYTLYYKGNYPRLQKLKATWDPKDVFQHPQSIELP